MTDPAKNPSKAVLVHVALLLAAVVWAYWTVFETMWQKWSTDPQYSHGYLVPLFALALLWMRREHFDSGAGGRWLGVLLLVAGLGLQIASTFFYYEWFVQISILPTIAGAFLLTGGWPMLRWAIPAVAFLFFMIPLPFTLEVALQYPLRHIGTISSVYVMQTLGMPAFAEGNVIVMDDVKIGVAEACSGLRMLMIFFALTTAVALLSTRPLWERLLILFSAVPIALISNITRITVTGMLYGKGHAELADLVFHDLAGWLMMPFALLLLWFECWLLSRLFLVEDHRPVRLGIEPSAAQS